MTTLKIQKLLSFSYLEIMANFSFVFNESERCMLLQTNLLQQLACNFILCLKCSIEYFKHFITLNKGNCLYIK